MTKCKCKLRTGLQAAWILCLSSLPPDSRPRFPNEMQNVFLSEKRTYPISSFQSTLHLICFDTALCEQPPHSVMTFCDLPSLWRVSMIVFWTIIDGHLMKLKCKYSNILRY